nr:hypothetical protein CFP56_00591 [Quercus suber]
MASVLEEHVLMAQRDRQVMHARPTIVTSLMLSSEHPFAHNRRRVVHVLSNPFLHYDLYSVPGRTPTRCHFDHAVLPRCRLVLCMLRMVCDVKALSSQTILTIMLTAATLCGTSLPPRRSLAID